MGLYNTHYTVEIIGTTVHVLHINVFYGYHRVIHVDNMVTTDDELSVVVSATLTTLLLLV